MDPLQRIGIRDGFLQLMRTILRKGSLAEFVADVDTSIDNFLTQAREERLLPEDVDTTFAISPSEELIKALTTAEECEQLQELFNSSPDNEEGTILPREGVWICPACDEKSGFSGEFLTAIKGTPTCPVCSGSMEFYRPIGFNAVFDAQESLGLEISFSDPELQEIMDEVRDVLGLQLIALDERVSRSLRDTEAEREYMRHIYRTYYTASTSRLWELAISAAEQPFHPDTTQKLRLSLMALAKSYGVIDEFSLMPCFDPTGPRSLKLMAIARDPEATPELPEYDNEPHEPGIEMGYLAGIRVASSIVREFARRRFISKGQKASLLTAITRAGESSGREKLGIVPRCYVAAYDGVSEEVAFDDFDWEVMKTVLESADADKE